MGFLNNNIKRHLDTVKRCQIVSKFYGSNTPLVSTADYSNDNYESNTNEIVNTIVKELISMGQLDLSQFLTNKSEEPKCETLVNLSDGDKPESNESIEMQIMSDEKSQNEKIVDNNNIFSQDDLSTLYSMQFKGRCVEDVLDPKTVPHGILKLENDDKIVDVEVTSPISKTMLKSFQKPDLLCEIGIIEDQTKEQVHSTNELDDLYCLQFKTRCVDDYIDNTSEGVENAFIPFKVIGDNDLYEAPLIDIDDGSETKLATWTDHFQANNDVSVIDWLKKLAKTARVNRADTIGENGCLRKRAGGKVSDLRYVRPIEFQ